MKHCKIILAAMLCLSACRITPDTPSGGNPDTPGTPGEITKGAFAKGADISWVTQMESDGQKFYDASGNEKECTALMQDIGFNAIRLRVWVNPEDGWCGKDDVVKKARRAQDLGMRIMIDFHYSDSWADPGKQNPLAQWKNLDVVRMATTAGTYTGDVLKELKDKGIDVEWVQIGNEVNGGMLWPLCKVQGNDAANFVSVFNGCCTKVKEIYPSAKVIIHVSNGHDAGLFDWFFGLMKAGNAQYDIIGMSLYPVWWENNGWNDWKANVDKCIANIKALNSKFGKSVMLCEIGMPVSEPKMAKEAIQYILDETGKIEDCHGVFYWEPQTDGIWKPSSYEELNWSAYNMGAFRNGRPTIALDPFKN